MKLSAALRALAASVEEEEKKLSAACPNEAPPAYEEEQRAADRRGIERRTLYDARKSGELAYATIGRRIVYATAELDRWIAAKMTRQSKEAAIAEIEDPLERAIASGKVRRIGGSRP